MTRLQVGNAAGLPARAGKNINGGNDAGAGFATLAANIATVDAARTRLKAISGTTYTDARLDQMTFNDMVYAIRVNDAPGSL